MIVLLIAILREHFHARMVYAIPYKTTAPDPFGGRENQAGGSSPVPQRRAAKDTARSDTSGLGRGKEGGRGGPPEGRESPHGRSLCSQVASVRTGCGAGRSSAARPEPPHSR